MSAQIATLEKTDSLSDHEIASREEWLVKAPEWAAELEDLSGDSVFCTDEAGQIFHTYSTFGRGGEEFLGIYRILDAMPKGRDENGPYHSLTDLARPRNMYGRCGDVEPNGRYHQPAPPSTIEQPAAA